MVGALGAAAQHRAPTPAPQSPGCVRPTRKQQQAQSQRQIPDGGSPGEAGARGGLGTGCGVQEDALETAFECPRYSPSVPAASHRSGGGGTESIPWVGRGHFPHSLIFYFYFFPGFANFGM